MMCIFFFLNWTVNKIILLSKLHEYMYMKVIIDGKMFIHTFLQSKLPRKSVSQYINILVFDFKYRSKKSATIFTIF